MSEVGHAGGRARYERSTRRGVLAALSAAGAAGVLPSPAAAEPDSERPKAGDLLVAHGSDSVLPLKPADIPIGGPPVKAWPYDAAGNVIRKGSRLNKILLLRLDSTTLEGVTQERAAEGIVAYSAICTHAGCDVGTWLDEEQVLYCECHESKFDPKDNARVTDGPAPRSLPALPLKVVDGRLVVAGPFTSRVGFENG